VCSDFINGSCKDENCRNAHLSSEEYANVVQKDQAYKRKKAEGAKVSSHEEPRKQLIVPSQVHLGGPSRSSASQASHHSEIHNQSISKGFSEDSNDIFTQWLSFINEEESAPAAVSPPPCSYSPAAEVPESEGKEGGQ